MKAIRIYEHGGLDKLIYDDLPQPDCLTDKVKINIKAVQWVWPYYQI